MFIVIGLFSSVDLSLALGGGAHLQSIMLGGAPPLGLILIFIMHDSCGFLLLFSLAAHLII